MKSNLNTMGTENVTKVKKKSDYKKVLRKLSTHSVLVALSILFLIPFIWMLSTSFKGNIGLFDLPPKWIPDPIQWDNYQKALTTIPFFRYLKNTVFITVINVVGVVLSSSFVAYAFARLRWPGRDLFFMVLMATLMLPGFVTQIPLFILFKNLGWLNTFLPLTVPAFFGGGAFNIFLIRQYYKTIPYELTESAKIDGSSEFRTYWNIILPLCKPILATVAIFTFMGSWNDFFGPLIYTTDAKMYTLALGLKAFQTRFTMQWNLLMAASIVVMMPTLLLFFFCQRYFIEGITLTGIKG